MTVEKFITKQHISIDVVEKIKDEIMFMFPQAKINLSMYQDIEGWENLLIVADTQIENFNIRYQLEKVLFQKLDQMKIGYKELKDIIICID